MDNTLRFRWTKIIIEIMLHIKMLLDYLGRAMHPFFSYVVNLYIVLT